MTAPEKPGRGRPRGRAKPPGSPLTESFGRELLALREARGWGIDRLAEGSGLHPDSLRRYEAGANEPTLSALAKIARAFGVSLSRFDRCLGVRA